MPLFHKSTYWTARYGTFHLSSIGQRCYRKQTNSQELNHGKFWIAKVPSENNIYREGRRHDNGMMMIFKVKGSQKSSQKLNNFPGSKNQSITLWLCDPGLSLSLDALHSSAEKQTL